LSAARHARDQAQSVCADPIAKTLLENMLELPVGHLQNALRKGAFLKNDTFAV
jgi:hypothetical protein